MNNWLRGGIGLGAGLAGCQYAQNGRLYADDYRDCAILGAAATLAAYLPAKAVGWASRRVFRGRASPLQAPILAWPTGENFTVEDMLRSVFCFGATGSGKSSGSRLGIERGILRTDSGGLALCSKPEDRQWLIDRLEEAGRSSDLILFSEDSHHRCNFLEFESRFANDARSLTQFLMTAGEVLADGKGGRDQDAFWRSLNERFIYNAIVPILIAYGKADAPSIHRFIAGAAYHPSQLSDEKWLSGYHSRTMLIAEEKARTDIEMYDYLLAHRFWRGEFCTMDDKPRSSGLLGVNNILHAFNSGLVRELCSGKTTFTPEDMGEGKWVVCDFPLPNYGASGRVIMAGLQYLTMRHILRRKYTPEMPYIVIEADEAQNVVNSFCTQFILEARSHGGCLFYMTQGITNYHVSMGNREIAEALYNQAGHKVFHPCDPITAAYASGLVGSAMQYTLGGSLQHTDDLGEVFNGKSSWSGSLNEGVRAIIEPREFMVGRTGGEASGLVVDSKVIRVGRPFANQSSCISVPWRQKKKGWPWLLSLRKRASRLSACISGRFTSARTRSRSS